MKYEIDRLNFLFIFLIIGLFASACHNGEHSHTVEEDHDHDEHHRLTVWDGEFEYFAEFEIHENSGRIEGELYLSLENQPLDAGIIQLFFSENGEPVNRQPLNVVTQGFYPFEIYFGRSDEPDLVVELQINGVQTRTVLGKVDRYADHPEDPIAEQWVELEKKMQWQLSMGSEVAHIRDMPETVSGLGRVTLNQAHNYLITSPVDGHVDAEFFSIIPVTGSVVNPGDRLLALSPPFSSGNSWTEIRLAYHQAQDSYERAVRLLENDAISLREYQAREREYESRRAGYEHFLIGNSHGAHIEDAGDYLYLNAYQSGVIAETYITPGKFVEQGDRLFSLFNPDYLWIEIQVYRDDLNQLSVIDGLEIQLNRDEPFTLDNNRIEVISRDQRSNISGNRVNVVVSVENHDRKLMLNQPLRVKLKSNQNRAELAVPSGAIFDDDSHKVVFVMISGDQFERRIVEAGNSYGGYTTILNGLNEGERIVTSGVYPLHLLSGNVQIDEGHDH